jgi:hypothetical protein
MEIGGIRVRRESGGGGGVDLWSIYQLTREVYAREDVSYDGAWVRFRRSPE